MTKGRGIHPHRRFTSEEDAVIFLEYKSSGDRILGERLSRHPASIRSRAQKLGVAVVSTVKRRKHAVNRVEATVYPEIPDLHPEPVAERLAKLAAFDPILARVVEEKRIGFAPGELINRSLAGRF